MFHVIQTRYINEMEFHLGDVRRRKQIMPESIRYIHSSAKHVIQTSIDVRFF